MRILHQKRARIPEAVHKSGRGEIFFVGDRKDRMSYSEKVQTVIFSGDQEANSMLDLVSNYFSCSSFLHLRTKSKGNSERRAVSSRDKPCLRKRLITVAMLSPTSTTCPSGS